MPGEEKTPDSGAQGTGGGGTSTPGGGSGAPAGGGAGDEQLGPAGVKALREEREARAKAERERDAITAERDKLKAQHQSAEEKALEAAKQSGVEEATLAANRRIVKSEVRAAAAGKVSDPEDAAALLGDLDRFIVKGEVDSKAVSSAIDDLVKAKPYLAAAGKAKPLPGGGATQTTGSSFNDELRKRIHRS